MIDQQTVPPASPRFIPTMGSLFDRGQLTPSVPIIVGVIVVAALAVIAIARFATRSDLPGCGSMPAKDVLSDIFKRKNVDAARYDEIKTLTTGDNETTCNATLTLRDNSKLVIDYKLYRDDSVMKLMITRSNP